MPDSYAYGPMDDFRQVPMGPAPLMGCPPPMVPPVGCPPFNPCPGPVCEPTRERCINRCFVHEVPHICPIHTRVVNTHVCRHTFRPAYTCAEQNVVCHVQEGSCEQFL